MKAEILAIAKDIEYQIEKLKSSLFVVEQIRSNTIYPNPPMFSSDGHTYRVPNSIWKNFLDTEKERIEKEIAQKESELQAL